jgi:CRP-like cAMP-binding protein
MRLTTADQRTLRECRLFTALDENDFNLLAQHHRVMELALGQSLFQQGMPAEAFFVVLEGWATLFRDQPNGNRIVIHLFGPGESFAEALISADNLFYPVSAEAASRLRVARFDLKIYRDLVSQSPRLALAVISAVFKQLRGLVDQIEHHSGWPPRRRIAGFLLRMCRAGEGENRFDLPLEQQLIAARLSMTPWTFSRELGRLSELGVDAKRGQIVIHDTARLARFVSGEGE